MSQGLKRIYSHLANTYELTNHMLTWGLDKRWREKAAQEASHAGGSLWLDVCSGTGEMAQLLSKKASSQTKIVSLDFCFPMLEKALHKNYNSPTYFTIAQANCLPFPDEYFNLITISFATRNISPSPKIMDSFLKEFYRILKPGGYFINLETSQPQSKLIRKLFHLYVKMTVEPLGFLISGSKPGYKYLSSSIPRFYSPQEFSKIIKSHGFNRVKHKLLFLGVAAIHVAVK